METQADTRTLVESILNGLKIKHAAEDIGVSAPGLAKKFHRAVKKMAPEIYAALSGKGVYGAELPPLLTDLRAHKDEILNAEFKRAEQERNKRVHAAISLLRDSGYRVERVARSYREVIEPYTEHPVVFRSGSPTSGCASPAEDSGPVPGTLPDQAAS